MPIVEKMLLPMPVTKGHRRTSCTRAKGQWLSSRVLCAFSHGALSSTFEDFLRDFERHSLKSLFLLSDDKGSLRSAFRAAAGSPSAPEGEPPVHLSAARRSGWVGADRSRPARPRTALAHPSAGLPARGPPALALGRKSASAWKRAFWPRAFLPAPLAPLKITSGTTWPWRTRSIFVSSSPGQWSQCSMSSGAPPPRPSTSRQRPADS